MSFLRVISQYQDYGGPTVRPERSELVTTDHGAERRIVQKALRADPFTAGGLTEYEVLEAHKRWPHMRGLADGALAVARFSVFDSKRAQIANGWTDEETLIVEEGLRHGPSSESGDYMIVEHAKAPAPYPKYDAHRKVQGRRTIEHALTDIQSAYESTGFDIAQAVAYERENLNDDRVTAALEALAGEKAQDEELIEA